MSGYVSVPHDKLSTDALEALLEEFITREGTDYGLREHSLAEKLASVRAQLARGDVVIVFDPRSESVTLMLRTELARSVQEQEREIEP